jgi:sulfotransferase
MKEVFYQSSLPRSGSTLLQNIIGQNPDFYVTPTSGLMELLYGARAAFTHAKEFKAQDQTEMLSAFRGFCAGGVHGFFRGLTDKPYVVDKGRGWGVNYSLVSWYQDNPKMVCTVRDLRSVFSSMEKQYRKSKFLQSEDVNEGELKGVDTQHRVDVWGEGIPTGLAIKRLKQIILEGNDEHILFVRYEDLMLQPQTEMDRIYNYFGLPSYAHNFNNIPQITVEDDEVYGVVGNHKIRPILNQNPDDYLDILGDELSNRIKKQYQWFYEYFNYK